MSSRNRFTLIAATAAAAVALSACSGTSSGEPKPWPNVGTGGAVAAPTSAAVKTPTFVWENVDGQGHEGERDATPYRAQFGLDPLPGVEIIHAKGAEAGDTATCTLGPAVATGYLTAGHCAKGHSADQYLMGSPTGDPRLLGTAAPVAAGPVDAAVIPTSQVSGAATRIATVWPVAGVLTAAGVQQLVPVGSYVCFDGAVSGVRCGERVADEGGQLVYSAPSEHGDSGAPVFVVDSTTHSAALIGILSEGDDVGADRKSTATYLDAALMATGTAVKLDPHTTPFDAPQRGLFSQRISIQ